jgi:hypothetical protein
VNPPDRSRQPSHRHEDPRRLTNRLRRARRCFCGEPRFRAVTQHHVLNHVSALRQRAKLAVVAGWRAETKDVGASVLVSRKGRGSGRRVSKASSRGHRTMRPDQADPDAGWRWKGSWGHKIDRQALGKRVDSKLSLHERRRRDQNGGINGLSGQPIAEGPSRQQQGSFFSSLDDASAESRAWPHSTGQQAVLPAVGGLCVPCRWRGQDGGLT